MTSVRKNAWRPTHGGSFASWVEGKRLCYSNSIIFKATGHELSALKFLETILRVGFQSHLDRKHRGRNCRVSVGYKTKPESNILDVMLILYVLCVHSCLCVCMRETACVSMCSCLCVDVCVCAPTAFGVIVFDIHCSIEVIA